MYTITGPENHLIYLALKKKTQVLITMKVKLPNYRPQQANKYLSGNNNIKYQVNELIDQPQRDCFIACNKAAFCVVTVVGHGTV